MSDIYNKYKIALPAQGRTAIEGVGKLLSSLIGCSGNSLPTNSNETTVIHPSGSKVCYQLGGSSYTATLLEDMRSDYKSTRAVLSNGKETMLENDWVTGMTPTCGQDNLPNYDADEKE